MKQILSYKKPILLWAHIITQFSLYWFYLIFVKKESSNPHILILSSFFSLTIFISFFILLEEREKTYIYRVCTTLLWIPLYFILEDILVSYVLNNLLLLRYFFIFQLIFSYMDIILEGQYHFNFFRLGTVLFFLIIFLLSNFSSLDVNFLFLWIYFLLCLFPLLFFLIKRKDIDDRGLYSYQLMILTSSFLALYLLGSFYFSSFWNYLNNFEEFYMMSVLAGVLIYLLIKSYHLSFKDFSSPLKKWIQACFLLFLILFMVNGFPSNFFQLFFLAFYLSAFFVMISSYFNYQDLSQQDIDSLLDKSKENLLLDKYAQLYAEKNTRFLHDMILQDNILLQKLVQRAQPFEEKEQILAILSSNIKKIRQELNAYDPILNPRESLNNTYYQLIKDLEDKYQNQGILIDFTCPDDFLLPGPYDRFIYKILYELVSNLFKHGKGFYTEIQLEEKQEQIFLSMVNYGDYLDKNFGQKSSTGLKLLTFETKRLGGHFTMKEGQNQEEGYLAFYLDLPIKKERIHEDYVNRRS